MSRDIPKAYEPGEVEGKWYAWWEERGLFQADNEVSGPVFSMVMPPPNVTGKLHMGHALNNGLQDILARWKRMKGFNVLWLPGVDHASIATQNVVERQLQEEGRTRFDLGREAFERRAWEWKDEAERDILNQLRRLGCSCDWTRKRFTMDPELSRAVVEVFVNLYEEGLIYRGEYLVNWCPRCTTAISDLEVEHRETQGRLWHIRYPVQGARDSFLEVATTRPETMLGDTAVAVHPEDERYARLVGRSVILPLIRREIPVIADSFVDREFGTGAVKVTPGHDPNDFEAGRRHQLELVQVIGEEGRMTAAAGPYQGLDRYQARRRVVADLEAEGLLAGVEDYVHSIGQCQRCQTVVEPLVSRQWFVKVQSLARPAIRAVEEGHTVFVPGTFAKVYFDWMKKIRDWCISRQLWWGHRIPAWYCRACDRITVSRETPNACSHCGDVALRQEEDVLDTWFSSALWPFSTLGWPGETPDLERYYPTSTLVTAFDIIFFWVARMMMMGLRFRGEVPFRQVHINGLVRDEQGRKMSKSRGNAIDPLQIMDEYGTDALRFTLAAMAVPGTDIPFSESRLSGYRAFCNKIWNAGRFLLINIEEESPVRSAEIDRYRSEGLLEEYELWILSRLQGLIEETDRNLEKFRFHEASNELYQFFWREFCDWFVELSKSRVARGEGEERRRAGRVALYVLETSLRLLHPFIPFITEELWQRLPHAGDSIMLARFPSVHPGWIDPGAEERMTALQELITSVRTARSEHDLDPRARLPIRLLCRDRGRELLEDQLHHLRDLARVEPVEFVTELPTRKVSLQGVSRLADFSLALEGAIDVGAEKERLKRQIERLEANVKQLARKLENQGFLTKAPEHVVAAAREHHAQAREQLHKLQQKLDALS